jgi:hypothetical protein
MTKKERVPAAKLKLQGRLRTYLRKRRESKEMELAKAYQRGRDESTNILPRKTTGRRRRK